jgi:hypothetical protein
MSTCLNNMHPAPDVWVLVHPDIPHLTGFQMLTPRAKKWALTYKEADSPSEVDDMIWVRSEDGVEILQDITNKTRLHVLLDEGDGLDA